jgi:ATP-dependent RNA helicase DeaD
MKTFENLGIMPSILKVIQEEKFEEPSEIQEKAIPLILKGENVIAGSATGSGKTLAFGAGIIKKVEKGKGIQALVLTPTRELAEQVANALIKFSKYKPLKVVSIYGGVAISPQIKDLETADIVVGTPGRILDHMGRGTIYFDKTHTLVLDEADRMFDMGFKDDVEKIIRKCPPKRQTMLFSATISSDVIYLSKRYTKDPVEVSAEVYVDPDKLSQIYYDVPDHSKFSLLVHLLNNEKAELVMVFCNTQRNTDFVAKNLKFAGIKALAIHGGFSQSKRTQTINSFHTQEIQVLVCTDVASRGLDIKGVSHIYNYDLPSEPKSYIHRIGRTARAGKQGKVINILASRDYSNFSEVVSRNEVKIKKEELPKINRVRIRWMESKKSGGRFSRDRSNGRSGSRSGGRSSRGRSSNGPGNKFRRDHSSGRSGGRSGSRQGNRFGRNRSSGRSSGRSNSRSGSRFGRNRGNNSSGGSDRRNGPRKRRF